MFNQCEKKRVFNIIKDWLSNGFYDFDEDPQLFGKLNSFSQIINPAWKSQLEKVIQKKVYFLSNFIFLLYRSCSFLQQTL